MSTGSQEAATESAQVEPPPDGPRKAAAEARLRNPRAAVYGAIAAGALLAAESPRRETYTATVGAVLVALVLYWLADTYASLIGERLTGRHPLTPGRVARALVHEVSILAGAVPVLGAVVASWLAGATLPDAVAAAIWTDVAIIVAIEVVAGVRAHLEAGEMVLQTAVGVALGLLIVALRVILH